VSQELGQYIEELSQEGLAHSAGSFSIDYASALEKLSSRLFADSTAYLVKLVQAALRSGAPEVKVRTRRERTWVEFYSARITPESLTELSHLTLGKEEEPALGHLARAFHTARALRPRRLSLSVAGPSGGQQVVYEKGEVSLAALDARAEASNFCQFSFEREGVGRAAQQAEEQLRLSDRCRFSPSPVLWDGRILNPSRPGPSGRLSRLLDRIYLSTSAAQKLLTIPHLTSIPAYVYDFGKGYKDHYSFGDSLLLQIRAPRSSPFGSVIPPEWDIFESNFVQEVLGLGSSGYAINQGLIRSGNLQGKNNGYQVLYLADLGHFTTSCFPVSRGFLRGKQPSLCAQAWLSVETQPSTKSGKVFLQQDGVLLDPVEVELPMAGAVAYISWPSAATDLSGLVPVQDNHFRALVDWASGELFKACKDLRQALRWHDKYGISEQGAQNLQTLHQLHRDY
jgi:hypothetical protein